MMLIIIIMIIIIYIPFLPPGDSEIPSWRPAEDTCVSQVGRTLKPWLATFLGEGKL